MKKAFLLVLAVVISFGLVNSNLITFGGTGRNLNEIENEISRHSHLSHKELYNDEVQKIVFRFNQEPYLQLNQRYSRKLLAHAETNILEKTESKTIEKDQTVSTEIQSKAVFFIQRIERSSGLFHQAKIYATVKGKNADLKSICKEIREHFAEFNSLVICLYDHNEVGISLALGEKTHFAQHVISESWLVFYSYHPVEGDYFDDEPGKFLGS